MWQPISSAPASTPCLVSAHNHDDPKEPRFFYVGIKIDDVWYAASHADEVDIENDWKYQPDIWHPIPLPEKSHGPHPDRPQRPRRQAPDDQG